MASSSNGGISEHNPAHDCKEAHQVDCTPEIDDVSAVAELVLYYLNTLDKALISLETFLLAELLVIFGVEIV